MNIIVDRISRVLVDFDTEVEYMRNGYPRLVNKDIAFVADDIEVFTGVDIPENVVAGKYCYTEEDGFYLNPDYEEPNPYGLTDEQYNEIVDSVIAQVQEGVING
ncbi:hypothetical protein D1155_07855 [Anaerotruncus sp. 80]|uniref:Uncharacterized protein n=1 Tax=Anaerotruncus colihominis TaxID=169435 RepID=A0A845QKF1_9FIRM|nr:MULTISPECIES: hypothetical protein [Anaerotruncus]NBH61561.1 hypothetical protein [Anaerotruncus colihominis]NCF02216.1 hypothetical protein [Anaerotruncus sp. 80]